ncbi:MAG: hypothetical protein ACFFCI_09695 [Promethearchaeota archaeon]
MSLKKNIVVSKIAIVIILIFIFIVIMSSDLQLLTVIYPIVGWWYFVGKFIFSLFLFFLISYIILCSGRLMFLFSALICLISGFCFIFLAIIQHSTIEYLITKIIFIGLFLLGILLSRLHLIKNTFILNLISISASIALVVIGYGQPFFYTKVVLFLLFECSYEAMKNSFYNFDYRKTNAYFFLRNNLITYSLVGLMLFSTITISAIPTYVKINATNSPELIFWASTGELPRDEDTLGLCRDHDVGFAVVLREHYIDGDDFGASEARRIEYLLNHSIITYIVLGGGRDGFYLTTDNANEFHDIFKTIRSWLILNNLYYGYENMRGFLVDAEIPKNYYSDLENKDMFQKGEYLINQMPSDDRLQKLRSSLSSMIKDIHIDEKKIGIIKLPTLFDQIDGDDDYNKLSNTIYSLDLPWDLSISMNYRTMSVPTVWDYLIRDTSKYDYTTDYEPAYLEKSEAERNLVPLSTFFQEVSYEIYSSDVNVKRNHRFIFIGTFKKEFKDTSYIQNKEYKKDLDVCRHFGMSKVFFYDYSGFTRFYNLSSLIKYNEDRQSWVMWIPNYMITREFYAALVVIVIDKMFSI